MAATEMSSDSDVSDHEQDEYDGWDDGDSGFDMQCVCLFCDNSFTKVEAAWEHCAGVHAFDTRAIIRKHSLDNFGYIKMINYIRRNKVGAQDAFKLTPEDWNDEGFLKPAMEDDGLLTFDPESVQDEEKPTAGGGGDVGTARTLVQAPTHESTIVGSTGGKEPSSEEIIRGKDLLIGNLLRDIGMMRATFQSVVLGDSDDLPDARKERERKNQGAWDDGYFSAYGHHSIHQEMLQDRVRTGCYREAILKNTEVIRGKKVLDLGCGTGILSMFCVQAGAERVVGVDNAEVIVNTFDIIRENGMEKEIKLLRAAIEDLDDEPALKDVDIIVSEWMGYFLLFEGMLKSVMHARDKHLRPGGLILPNKCDLFLVPVSDSKRFERNVNMWDDVYGFRMSSMKTDYLKEVSVEVIDPAHIVAEPALLKSFDLATCQPSDLCVETSFEFVITRKCELTYLAGYFDAVFELPVPVTLPTGPWSEPTHWKQAIFYLRQPMPVEEGERVSGVIKLLPRPEDRRAYGVSIRLKDMVLKTVIH